MLQTAFLSAAATRASRLRKPALSLEHFVQRQRVLKLWREVVRGINKIPPSSTRNELRAFARQEFERNKNVTDLTHIRYLISKTEWRLSKTDPGVETGKAEFDAMRRYIDEQAA